jgi:hypothetical protein
MIIGSPCKKRRISDPLSPNWKDEKNENHHGIQQYLSTGSDGGEEGMKRRSKKAIHATSFSKTSEPKTCFVKQNYEPIAIQPGKSGIVTKNKPRSSQRKSTLKEIECHPDMKHMMEQLSGEQFEQLEDEVEMLHLIAEEGDENDSDKEDEGTDEGDFNNSDKEEDVGGGLGTVE